MSHELEFPTECRDKLVSLILSGNPLSDPKEFLCCAENVGHFFLHKYVCDCCDDDPTPPLIGAETPAELTEAELCEHLASYDPTLKMGVPFWVQPLLVQLFVLVVKAVEALRK